ncbi:ketopantoate reductase PanE/ApbA C terminal-domain-containing protein [Flammula alnicola]|nr:ketopantoate reductase PanE/ApbA C terminal-domain-containing protein [Flammula alnicola]
MHLHILGLGSIGCLLAHNLRRVLPSQHIITLIHKTAEERQHFLKRGSICIEHYGVQSLSQGFQHELSAKFPESSPPQEPNTSPSGTDVAVKNDSPIDSVFVALKAQHTMGAMKALAHRISANSTIVLLQNGMGIYEQLVSEVFRNPDQRPHFILASNTHGAFVKHSFHVIHAGVGTIEFGITPDTQGRDYEAGLHDESIDPPERRLRLVDILPPGDQHAERYKSLRDTVAAFLLMQDLNVFWKSLPDLQLLMQRKLVVNAAINPLTALLGCRNGDAFNHQYGRDILQQVCQEASAVFAAQMDHENQMELQELRRQGIDTRDIQLPALPELLSPELLEKEVLRVADITKGNISSMLQDVRRGRKSEIDFINGYLEKLGYDYGIRTPVNATLCRLVKLNFLRLIDPEHPSTYRNGSTFKRLTTIFWEMFISSYLERSR